MLANAQQRHRAGVGLRVNFFGQARHGGHVAVLHGHPDRCRVMCRQCLQGAHVLKAGAGRFFEQQGQRSQTGNLLELFGMPEVGAGDHQAIDVFGCDHIFQAAAALRAGCQSDCVRSHGLVRFKDARDSAGRQECDVAQMLLAHHAAADKTVAQYFHWRPYIKDR